MLRYIRKLCDKDIALDRAMIPLGSCTMKLNATSEMLPVSWPEFSSIHPLAPLEQVSGYMKLISELEEMLIRENRMEIFKKCLSFLDTRVELDQNGFKFDISEH